MSRSAGSTASIGLVVAAVAVSSAGAVLWHRFSRSQTSPDTALDSPEHPDESGKYNRMNGIGSNDNDATVATAPRSTTRGTDPPARPENSDAPVSEIRIGDESEETAASLHDKQRILTKGLVTIVHGSMTGTCRQMAAQLWEDCSKTASFSSRNTQLGTVEDWDWWDELLNDEDDDDDQTQLPQDTVVISDDSKDAPVPLLILFLPTYTNGTWPPCATPLQSALQDLQNDWRIAKFPLKHKLQVAIFGMGSSAYDDAETGASSMGQPAREAVRAFQKLGAKCVVRLAVGDNSVGTHANETFAAWQQDLWQQLVPKVKQSTAATSSCACASEGKTAENAGGCCSSSNKDLDANEEANAGCCSSPNNDDDDDNESYYSEEEDDENEEPAVMDLEDMGDAMLATQAATVKSKEPREMVTPSQAAALKKEGYKLIGTHSAVKLCRWTKHQLRGRGGCYKHTFYGITSYQCMEATPSLACANKCVFCWRHHKNPVGKEWRWKTDDPYFIVDQAVNTHVQMIKEAKGIPGVRMDRWQEAHTVRHCALSLVGEPIMYPRIGELLGDLHRRKISTFLVTNGQHPHAIGTLRPITQLYVSVDAPTQESLIEIDRPLFNDAWDRLKQSLVSLKDKGQRTVARLTVVKGWNSDEIEGYAKLIVLGKVSLVEVKGVTFCGKSDASNLNMTNSPWHHEVVELTRTLKDEIQKIRDKGGDDVPPEYGLACEHKHSCSVLLARVDQFSKVDPATGQRKWQTWIDYDRFQELAAMYEEDPTFTFGVEDYVADTPAWALFGAEEEGFDPTDKRHRRPKKHPKYTRYDEHGVPTHDDNDEALSLKERGRLSKLMDERLQQIGTGTVVTELKGGAKEVVDASLMFRGMVVAK